MNCCINNRFIIHLYKMYNDIKIHLTTNKNISERCSKYPEFSTDNHYC